MNTWRLRRVDPTSPEWEQFLLSHDHLVFHEPAWARVMQEGLGAEPCGLLIEHEELPVGGMVGGVIKVLGIRSLHLGIPYGGVLAVTPPGDHLARLLTEFAQENDIAQVVLTPFPTLGAGPADGFAMTELNTYLLHIGNRDHTEIWADYKKRLRRDVRKAERSGAEIEISAEPQALEAFYSLYLASMRRNQAIPKYGRAFVQAISDHLLQSDRGALMLAKMDDRYIAGILVVDSADGCHYLMGGSNPEALHHQPNELLINAAIERAADRALSFFDFLPSGVGHESLEQFKKKWGCESLPANSYQLVTRPAVYTLWTAARRLAANPLIRKILYTVRR